MAGERIRRRWITCTIAGVGLCPGSAPILAKADRELPLVVTSPVAGALVGAKFAVGGTVTGAPKGAVIRLRDRRVPLAADGTFEFGATAEKDGEHCACVAVNAPATVECGAKFTVNVVAREGCD